MKGKKEIKGKTKVEKGITLVALIITIVVLLILAVVTISSIQNDGILSYAENAAAKYNKAVKDEEGLLGYYQGYLEYGGELTEEEYEELEIMKRYALGAAKTGRPITDIMDMETMAFQDDEETTDVDESSFTLLNVGINANSTKGYFYVKYNNRAYKIVVDATTFMTEEVKLVYSPEGREGQEVEGGTYDGWIILTDRNGLVEIVSPDVMKDVEGNVLTLELGSGDTSVNVTTDLDGDESIYESDGTTIDYEDRAIASYNNAITRINNYCKQVMNLENVRSVGGTNNNFTPYSSTNYDNWGSNIKVEVASGDMQHELDFVKLSYFGKLATTENYWLASRGVYEDSESEGVCFGVGSVEGGVMTANNLWIVYSDGGVGYGGFACGVRPVVINPSGI